MAHKHEPLDNTWRGKGSGGAKPRCAAEERGKYCGNEHLAAQCQCGAQGVYCHDHGWVWTARDEQYA